MISRLITASIRRQVTYLLLFGFVLLGGPEEPLQSQNSHTGEAQEKAPLRYRLIVSEPSVCAKEGINLELELENVSSGDVLVDPRELLHTVDISRTGRAIVSRGDLMAKASSDFIALAPGRSYRKSVAYPLQGSLFSIAGLYNIHVSYGQFEDPSPKVPGLYKGVVQSNTVLFEIKDCS